MADKSKSTVIHVLVTGAAGYLGPGITASLHQRHPQWKISSMDLVEPSPEQQTYLHRKFTADVTSATSVQAVFQDYVPDIVVHCAGIVPARSKRYSTSAAEWQRVKAVNYDGTRHVVDAAIAAGCRKLVYTSSCTVAIDDLDHDYFYMDETVPIGFATLHYGKSKGLAEQYVLDPRHAEKGFKACALRPCTIIGEGDTAVVGVFYDLIIKGETNFIVGDGDNIYDFMHITNAVLAHVLAVENMVGSATAAGHAFFISNQEPVYFWDFLAFVWAQFGHIPPRRWKIPGGLAWAAGLLLESVTWVTGGASTLDRGSVKDGIRTHYSNNTKAIEILGYRPVVSLSDGVKRACQVCVICPDCQTVHHDSYAEERQYYKQHLASASKVA